MHLAFRSSKLEKICLSERELQKHFGEYARRIGQRLNDLSAAVKLADIPITPPFRLHEHKGKYKGYFTVDTIHPYRILFHAVNPPLKTDGGINLDEVREIVIENVHYDPH